jgi:hypothetical protein
MMLCGIVFINLSAAAEKTHRTTPSLDGQWDVQESVDAFEHG